MKYFLRFLFFLICSVLSFSCLSCSRRTAVDIHGSDSLALSPEVEWAVVSEPYVAFRNEAGYENHVVEHGRRGETMRILGKDFVRSENIIGEGKTQKTTVSYITWYKFEKGWLEESCVSVYDNKFKAEHAASSLK